MTGEKIQSISSVHIPKEFRTHFYKQDLDITFPRANLLAGSNGTGKTSVFSAIELAMTGSVKKQQKAHDPAEKADVVLELSRGLQKEAVRKVLTAAEKKERETKWYRSRVEKRTAPQLNEQFHRFNYFTVDDAYLFTSDQPDPNGVFSEILYGPEIISKWNNSRGYQKRCLQAQKQLKSELNNLLQEECLEHPVKVIDENNLWSYIAYSGIKIAPNTPIEDILDIITKIQAQLNRVAAYKPVPTHSEVIAEKGRTQQSLQKTRVEKNRLDKQMLKQNTVLRAIQLEIDKRDEQLKATKKHIKALSPLTQLIPELEFIDQHKDLLAEYQRLHQRKEKIGAELVRLDDFWDKYQDLLGSSVPPDVKNIEMNLKKTRNDLEGRLTDIKTKIDNAQKLADKQQQTWNQLRSIGRKFIRQNPDLHQCPLCGTPNIGAADIDQHLQLERACISTELDDLDQEQLAINDALEKLEEKEEEITAQIALAERIQLAYEQARQLFPDIEVDIPLVVVKNILKEHGEKQQLCSEITLALETQKTRIKEAMFEVLGRQDFEMILDAERRTENLLIQNNCLGCEGIPIFELIQRIRKIWTDLTQTERRLQEEVADYIVQKESVSTEELLRQSNQCHELLSNLEQDEKKWSNLDQFWRNIAIWVSIEQVGMDGAALQAHCEKLEVDIRNIVEYASYTKESQEREAKRSRLNRKIKAYGDLADLLEQMKKPETYAQEFICQNIEQISRIFLSLHLPQEFSGLTISGKDLVGLRGEEQVPVVSMSTGQRTALALSVFFQLHLSNQFAPAFLLVDEPVANIDELNILSLMDFLRELVISHDQQIFVTTANRNVAQLFRRKFSFLGKDFQRLDFFRKSTDELEVIQYIYNQERVVYRDQIR